MKRNSILVVLLIVIVASTAFSQEKKPFSTKDLHGKTIKQVLQQYVPQLYENSERHPISFAEGINQGRDPFEIKQAMDSMDIFDDGMLYEKEKYTYNGKGQCVEMLFSVLDEDNINMTPYSRMYFTYWPEGQVKIMQYQKWRVDLNEWENFFKIESTYENHLLSEAHLFSWELDANEWESITKDYYNYDNENRLISIISYFNYFDNWVKIYKEEYTFNADGYPYLWIDYDWELNDWVASSKWEHFFDENGDMDYNLQSEWSFETNSWLDLYKSEYTYNVEHQRLTSIYSYFDEESSQWLSQNMDEYFYDEYGNRNIEIDYTWVNESWEKISKDEFVFDYSYNAEDLLFPNEYAEDYTFSHMLTEVNYFSWSNDWEPWSNNVLYYSPKNVNALVEVSGLTYAVYPNPSAGTVWVESDHPIQQLEVYNTMGQKVFNKTLNSYHQQEKLSLQTNSWIKGIYFIKIKGVNGQMNTVKLFVE